MKTKLSFYDIYEKTFPWFVIFLFFWSMTWDKEEKPKRFRTIETHPSYTIEVDTKTGIEYSKNLNGVRTRL